MSDDDPIGHTFVTRDDVAALKEAVRSVQARFRRLQKKEMLSAKYNAAQDVFHRLKSLLAKVVHAVEHFEMNKLDPECFWCQHEKERHESNMRDMPAHHRRYDAERCLICRIEPPTPKQPNPPPGQPGHVCQGPGCSCFL